jgi:hypothetical protein
MIMFDRDYQIRGKHATYSKYLVKHKDNTGAPIFNRFIDIYMIGAIMGFMHGKRAEEDNTVKDDVSILASTVIAEKDKLQFIYRLIMLLDTNSGLTLEERINRAFRDDSKEETIADNMKLFHSYVCGGIEYLYEKFNDCVTNDDFIDRIYQIVDRFKADIDNNLYETAIKNIIDGWDYAYVAE